MYILTVDNDKQTMPSQHKASQILKKNIHDQFNISIFVTIYKSLSNQNCCTLK